MSPTLEKVFIDCSAGIAKRPWTIRTALPFGCRLCYTPSNEGVGSYDSQFNIEPTQYNLTYQSTQPELLPEVVRWRYLQRGPPCTTRKKGRSQKGGNVAVLKPNKELCTQGAGLFVPGNEHGACFNLYRNAHMETEAHVNFEEVRASIQELLDFIPALPEKDESSSFEIEEDVLPSLPFHEQHIPEELSLKAVRILPSLKDDIARVFDTALAEFDHEKPDMPPAEYDSLFPRPPDPESPKWNAKSILDQYVSSTGSYALTLASTFFLHRESSAWATSLEWANRKPKFSFSSTAINEDFIATFCVDDPEYMLPEAWDAMDAETARLVRRAAARKPTLCVWQAFTPTPETEQLFHTLDTLGSHEHFPLIGPSTKGFPKSAASMKPGIDAFKIAGGAPMPILALTYSKQRKHRKSNKTMQPTRWSARLKAQEAKKKRKGAKGKNPSEISPKEEGEYRAVTVPDNSNVTYPGTMPPATVESIIQHAWYRAVEEDATFVVLHSGCSERIGIRHRGTQTLYLTENITPNECGGSGYGNLHVGLYMSVLKDVLDRERQRDDPTREQCQDTKRSLEHSAQRRSQRQYPAGGKSPFQIHAFTRGAVKRKTAKIQLPQAIADNTRDRYLALIRFQEGILQSPAPSSFVRVGGAHITGEKVDPAEYFTITLTSRMHPGATGDLHLALLNIHKPENLEYTVVVKLGYEPEQRSRMRNEAEIYEHLNSKGVRGIPLIFGLFQDVETRTLALVMENAGESVANLVQRGARERKRFTAEERNGFLNILENIHKAGVRHRDIRTVNLVMDDEGNPVIIDFDRALKGASQASRQKELEHLQGMLLGRHEDEPGEMMTLSEQNTPSFTMSG